MRRVRTGWDQIAFLPQQPVAGSDSLRVINLTVHLSLAVVVELPVELLRFAIVSSRFDLQ